MPSDPFNLIGTTLDGRYRVDACIGEGGFGLVYRGFHLSFEQDVAIKCLKVPAHFTSEARDLFLGKFREEGKHLAKLRHDAIVRVFDFGVATDADIPYLVLEWLDGEDLEQHLAQRKVGYSGREAATMLRPVVDAIAMAHRQGIAHRDLKPANIFLANTDDGTRLRVLDFGIAKAMQEGETATHLTTGTSSGFSAFSPKYGAPEQFRAKKYGATGPWTDVHALGLILVEMVTGRAPLPGEEAGDYFLACIDEDRPTPRHHGVDAGDAFEALCRRALARSPEDRFDDANELLEALDALPDEGLPVDSSKSAGASVTDEVASAETAAFAMSEGLELEPAPSSLSVADTVAVTEPSPSAEEAPTEEPSSESEAPPASVGETSEATMVAAEPTSGRSWGLPALLLAVAAVTVAWFTLVKKAPESAPTPSPPVATLVEAPPAPIVEPPPPMPSATASGSAQVPRTKSKVPSLAEWKEARFIPKSPKGCGLMIVREWLKMNCSSESKPKSIGKLVGFRGKGADLFMLSEEGKYASIVARMFPGRSATAELVLEGRTVTVGYDWRDTDAEPRMLWR